MWDFHLSELFARGNNCIWEENLTMMNTSIWCCVWRGNCQCASGTFGEPLGLTFLSLLTPCNHWGKDHHYLLPAEVFPGQVAPKAHGYLKNFSEAVNGPAKACEQSGKLASGGFLGSWMPWVPLSLCWRFSRGQCSPLGGVWESRNWKWKASKFCYRKTSW